MPANLAIADPEPGGLPPVFTATCLVHTAKGFGTGFFVGERANVVTALHVVRRAKHDAEGDEADARDDEVKDQPLAVVVCWVCTGRGFLFHATAEIVREDPWTDLALLRLKNVEEFPRPLSLDSLTSLSPKPALRGDFVYFDAFRRTGSGFEIRRVYGRVEQAYLVSERGFEQRYLMLDVKSWPGSSGSPVFSRSGEVIGVLTNGHRETEQAIIRDVPWVWELFEKTLPGTPPKRAGEVIPRPVFPAPVFAPYGNAEPARWRSWLKRAQGTLSPRQEE